MGSKPHFDGQPNEVVGAEGDYKFKPRAFNIVWGNDNRYWKIPKSGEEGPAELLQVSWLEVTASKELQPGKYSISFQISFEQGASGWESYPVFLMAKVGKKGRYSWKRVKLAGRISESPIEIPDDKFEIEVSGPDAKLYFGLYEVWSGKWKSGLKIHGATVKKVTA